MSCFSRDVTEQFLYVEMIEKQNEQLRQIAWVQSHEVRAPVASILGLADLFNCSNYEDPVNQQVIRIIKEATSRLDQVIIKTTSYTHETKL